MTPTDKAIRRIERDFVALNFRVHVAALKLCSSAEILIEQSIEAVARMALADARAANKLAREAIAAPS